MPIHLKLFFKNCRRRNSFYEATIILITKIREKYHKIKKITGQYHG